MSGIEPPKGGTVSFHRKAGDNALRGEETPNCSNGGAVDNVHQETTATHVIKIQILRIPRK